MGQKKELNPGTLEERLVVLWNRGRSTREIATELGRTTRAIRTLARQLRDLGVPLIRRGRRMDLDVLAQSVDLDRLRELAIAAKGGA